jgi:hypothetical protein
MRMLNYILNTKDSWPLPHCSKFSNKLTFVREGNLKIYNWPYTFCIVYSAIGTVQFPKNLSLAPQDCCWSFWALSLNFVHCP